MSFYQKIIKKNKLFFPAPSACPICKNGGQCDERSKKCICTDNYEGETCDKKKGYNYVPLAVSLSVVAALLVLGVIIWAVIYLSRKSPKKTPRMLYKNASSTLGRSTKTPLFLSQMASGQTKLYTLVSTI